MKSKTVLFAVFAFFALGVFGYDFLILSDTHYDNAELRVTDKLSSGKSKEKDRNLTAWAKTMPGFLQVLGKASEDNIDFVFHLGDLTQGDFGSGEMHAKALNQAKGRVCEFLKCPLYLVKGNHDIRGAGAFTECQKFFTEYEKSMNVEMQSNGVSYAFLHKGDLFIAFDSINPDIAFVRETLKRHADAKHVFFCTHLPVLPCSFESPAWIVFGKKEQTAERQELLSLLASRNATVLCGHIHRTTAIVAEYEQGRICQYTVFSQPKVKDFEAPQKRNDVLKDFPEAKKVKESKTLQGMASEYLPHMKSFESYEPRSGFARVSVNDKGVRVTFFLPDGKQREGK